MLTGKEIAERNIIRNFLEENIQQKGIDVRVCDIRKVNSTGGGMIPSGNSRKTKIPDTIDPSPAASYTYCYNPDGSKNLGWKLSPGYYEVMFDEGCDIPADCAMYFKTRSSGIRCGIEVRSGLFDPGFKTEHMGAFIKVELPVFIEEHARIAQVIIDSSSEAENLYNGQWQGDNQRINIKK